MRRASRSLYADRRRGVPAGAEPPTMRFVVTAAAAFGSGPVGP
ncbi:hypothetical protein PATSB16_37880 [Pandoraea thiooxydans]|nr:hypothetical protein PATSB16_37880 [Pandoraea thiooxydans]